jgi:ribosomal protein L40E
LTAAPRTRDHRAMKSAADIWICNVCRSINPINSNRCYRCHTPIQIAAAKPDELSVHQKPQTAHTTPVGTYRTTESLAVLVTVGAVAFMLAGLLALWTNYTINDLRASDGREAANALFQQRLLFLIPAPVIGVLALLAYAAWIRRIIENLPALGLGFARVSPTWAFVEPLIPGFNLYSIPARIAEVIEKLGGHLYATALIGLAWFLVVVPAALLVYLARFTGFLGTGAELLRVTSIGALVVFVFQVVALALMLVVLWQVEKLHRAKAASLGVANTAPARAEGSS